MAELELFRADVFTDELFLGNPANVVFEADGLDELHMQRIAAEAWAPVTSFVLRSRRADVRLRYFTPAGEDPLSGHGTIGALWCLADRKAFGAAGGRHRLETAVGVLPFSVEQSADSRRLVWMTQKRPMFAREGDVKEVASALGVGADALFHEEFPMSRVSTGMPCLLASVRSMDTISRLEPKQAEVTELCKELDVGAIIVYTWSVMDQGSTLHSRCFLPHPQPIEDAASGLGAGALGAYVAERDFVPREKLGDMVIEQGHWMGRASRIHVRIERRGAAVRKVEVGGTVRVSMKARIEVP